MNPVLAVLVVFFCSYRCGIIGTGQKNHENKRKYGIRCTS